MFHIGNDVIQIFSGTKKENIKWQRLYLRTVLTQTLVVSKCCNNYFLLLFFAEMAKTLSIVTNQHRLNQNFNKLEKNHLQFTKLTSTQNIPWTSRQTCISKKLKH